MPIEGCVIRFSLPAEGLAQGVKLLPFHYASHIFKAPSQLPESAGSSLNAVLGAGTMSPMESGFQCAGCGEWNLTCVDESAGRRQRYVEDCQVCCKANLLSVEYDLSAHEFVIRADLE